MKHPVLPVAGLLFVSGFCALVFQVVWFREFRLIFGASTAASAAVLAIFMGGLGIGNLVLGRRVDAAQRPLVWYAGLELGVALSAALSPLLVDLVRTAYVALGGQSTLGATGATAVRILLSIVVLGGPTILMGGTLPAAARAVTAPGDERRRSAAFLYGLNTLGAVAGALASTFVLIEQWGNRRTLWLACTLNLLTALAALALARRRVSAVDRPPPPVPRRDKKRLRRTTGWVATAAGSPAAVPPSITAPPAMIYASAGVVGFAFFVMELVWYRMLGPLLGGSTFTFGLILAVALAGIGFGGATYALLCGRLRPTLGSLAGTCALEALAIAIPFALGDRVALWTAWQSAALGGGDAVFWYTVGNWLLIAALVVLPAALVSGVQFPLLIALLGRGDAQLGRQIGSTVAWNTAGAIAGSLAGGFGLLPLLTAPGAWQAMVCLQVVLSLTLIGVAWRTAVHRRWTTLLPLVVAGLAIVGVLQPGPTAIWRHSGIGVGRATAPAAGTNALTNWENFEKRLAVWEADGVESSIAIARNHGLAFLINGKSDGSALGDAGTQIMLGLVAAALHPDPQDIFVVGLGTGETAGWLAALPAARQVDVVELEPAVNEMARRCAAINHDVLHHPKVKRIYNDAREVLLTTSRRYDLIVSEPSNPYRNGIAGLFTAEYYRAGRERLKEGGIFAQWVQGYEVDARTLRTIFATLRSVYPHIEVWQSTHQDLLLLGAQEPLAFSAAELRRRIGESPLRAGLAISWRAEDLEGFLARYIGGPALVERFIQQEPVRLNSDDRNDIEYGFARSLGKRSRYSAADLRQLAAAIGDQRPPLVDGDVDWENVAEQWATSDAASRRAPPPNPTLPPEQQVRRDALARWAVRDWPGGLKCWTSQPRPACCPTQRALLAYAWALAGDDRALAPIAALRSFQPTEAQALHGLLLQRQGRLPEAAQALTKAFVGLRADPWPLPEILVSAFEAAALITQADPQQGPMLFAALQEPLALDFEDMARRRIALLLASMFQRKLAAELAQTFEPHVPWTRSFLKLRLRVYQDTGHPLAQQAARDWDAFQRRADQEFDWRAAESAPRTQGPATSDR